MRIYQTILIGTLVTSIIFLQEGYSFYFSFQMLALTALIITILSNGVYLHRSIVSNYVWLLFAILFASKGFYSPFVVSRNSANIFFTTGLGISFSFFVINLPFLHFTNPKNLLLILRKSSSLIMISLAGLLIISESSIFSYLDNISMLYQNSRLVDNMTDANAIRYEIDLLTATNSKARIDLFYGEPSYLAIVLLSCIVCYLQSDRQLKGYLKNVSLNYVRTSKLDLSRLPPFLASLSMAYIDSLSSAIYSVVSIYFVFLQNYKNKYKNLLSILLVITFGPLFLLRTYNYAVMRLSVDRSLSFEQRFGMINEFNLIDFFVGITDAGKIPEFGIHNGIYYIVVVGGVFGILYLTTILYKIYNNSRSINLSSFVIFTFLAVATQNGGVFTPNKVVLFCLVLLPVACSQLNYSIRQRKSDQFL